MPDSSARPATRLFKKHSEQKDEPLLEDERGRPTRTRLQQGRKSRCSGRNCNRFDSVAKGSECPDHSPSAESLGLLAHRRAAFLIANAVMQNDPDQLTETM